MMYGSFSRSDINRLTYFEAEKYYDFYNRTEKEKIDGMFKLFAFHNFESTLMATRGNEANVHKYLSGLNSGNKPEENDIEAQFEGIKFG